MIKKHYLTWDLGGTKCDAGLIEYQSEKNTYVCLKKASVLLHNTQSLLDLVTQLETQLQLSMRDTTAICIGAAGQYNGHSLILENAYPYAMTFSDLAQELNWPHYAIIHDYATVLCGTFTQYIYSDQFVKRLNSPTIPIFERRVVFGIGTGLGAKDGLLLHNGDFWFGANEMGFLGLPTLVSTAHHAHTDFITYLTAKKHASGVVFETILSGTGLQLLYGFFRPMHPMLSPSDIGNLIEQGELDDLADLFAWYIGLFVATLQLAFMPAGGVWMTGGILLKHLSLLKRDSFQAGIEALPAYLTLRKTYPLGVLHHPDWALIGAAFYAHKRLHATQQESANNIVQLNTA